MTNDAKMVLDALFRLIWSLFNSWYIPGTNVTPAEFMLFLLFAAVMFRFLGDISGDILGGAIRRNEHNPGRIERQTGALHIPFRRR